MAKRQTVAEIEKRLANAKLREAYFKTNPQKSTYDAQPKDKYGYYSSSFGSATDSEIFILDVSKAAVTIFGEAAGLKLILPTAPAYATGAKPPRGFKPAKVSAVIGDATPTKVTAKTTNRKYVKYSRNASGSAQASYTAPVCGTGPLVTIKEQISTANAVRAALDSSLTAYGRFYFTPEIFNASLK